ncbi:MAG TPA: hypothetical protein VNL98_01800 [Gemmatimonadales bacterium]|nr:hypothetical protein [Gemmatimonadales bacterium]
MTQLIVVGAGLEALIGVVAFFAGGPMALVAALAGSGLAMGAQIAAVAVLRPAMKAESREFTRKWGLGVAIRFASFLGVAALLLAANEVLPSVWVAAGYLIEMSVLLFGESLFLR